MKKVISNPVQHLLTFEMLANGKEIELHTDSAGLDYLIKALQDLRDLTAPDHLHLMTDDWGGNSLSNEKQNLGDVKLAHHVKVFKW